MKKTSLLRNEIEQQPAVMQTLIDSEYAHIQSIMRELGADCRQIFIAARGSSDNTARYAQYLFGIRNRIPVALAAPSIFTLYETSVNLQNSLVVAISQSGASPDIVQVVQTANLQGAPTLAITNNVHSPLAQAAQHVIDIRAGEEKAVAATKTYTATLSTLALMSICLTEAEEELAQINKVPAAMQQVIAQTMAKTAEFARFKDIDSCVVIGRGYNYATAFELALKVKELSQIHAEPFSPADFLHGPIAILQSGMLVILVAMRDKVLEDVINLVPHLRQNGNPIIVISNDARSLEQADLALEVPDAFPAFLSPILAVIPGQILAGELAALRGLDPDNPQGLRKVTKTY